ncbi:hypothetical protein ACI79D_20180 [Geodermatophilus sp. SYSU D00708]
MRILFVCTGNVCRSPLAEQLATSWTQEKLAHSPEASDVHIGSAGLAATPNQEMDNQSAAALRGLGFSPVDFRSRVLTSELTAAADLVFTMTREQRRAVLEVTPKGLRKTFTLTEAADLLERSDLCGLALSPLTDRARRLGLRLDAARAGRATSDADDVADPIGQRDSVHIQVAEVIASALRPLADVLFTSVRTRLPAPVAV